jgi:hypothetical protein
VVTPNPMTAAMMSIFAFIVPIGIGRTRRKVYSPTIERPQVIALRPYLLGYRQVAYTQASKHHPNLAELPVCRLSGVETCINSVFVAQIQNRRTAPALRIDKWSPQALEH